MEWAGSAGAEPGQDVGERGGKAALECVARGAGGRQAERTRRRGEELRGLGAAGAEWTHAEGEQAPVAVGRDGGVDEKRHDARRDDGRIAEGDLADGKRRVLGSK